jgi:hypothetical protein
MTIMAITKMYIIFNVFLFLQVRKVYLEVNGFKFSNFVSNEELQKTWTVTVSDHHQLSKHELKF